MGFALYPYDHTCTPNRPRRGLGITLDKHGRLLLNADTFAALGLPGHVRLLYDRSAGVIGIQASREGDWHALRVCAPPSDPHSHRVSAKGFCTYFGLRPYLGQRYGGEMRDGMLRVPLEDQRAVAPTEIEPTERPAAPPEYVPLVGALSLPLPQVRASDHGRQAPRRGRHQCRQGLDEL